MIPIEILPKVPAQAETVIHCLEGAAAAIGFHQAGDISALNVSSLKIVDKFTYQGSSVSSIETNINQRLGKVPVV